MPPFDLTFQPSGRYLSFAEREEIALLKAQDILTIKLEFEEGRTALVTAI